MTFHPNGPQFEIRVVLPDGNSKPICVITAPTAEAALVQYRYEWDANDKRTLIAVRRE